MREHLHLFQAKALLPVRIIPVRTHGNAATDYWLTGLGAQGGIRRPLRGEQDGYGGDHA
jgi:hypothetical protein